MNLDLLYFVVQRNNVIPIYLLKNNQCFDYGYYSPPTYSRNYLFQKIDNKFIRTHDNRKAKEITLDEIHLCRYDG